MSFGGMRAHFLSLNSVLLYVDVPWSGSSFDLLKDIKNERTIFGSYEYKLLKTFQYRFLCARVFNSFV